jgi:hypothetical protein
VHVYLGVYLYTHPWRGKAGSGDERDVCRPCAGFKLIHLCSSVMFDLDGHFT